MRRHESILLLPGDLAGCSRPRQQHRATHSRALATEAELHPTVPSEGEDAEDLYPFSAQRHSRLPAVWYKARLGLVDGAGLPVQNLRATSLRKAIRDWMQTFGLSSPRTPVRYFGAGAAKLEWGGLRSGIWYDPADPRAVRDAAIAKALQRGLAVRNVPEKKGYLIRPEHWSERIALGLLWRGALLHLLGLRHVDLSGAEPWRTIAEAWHAAVDRPDPSPSLAHLTFGPDWLTGWWRGRLRPTSLAFSPGDRWVLAARPPVASPVIAVDIDLHQDAPAAEDIAHVEQRIRFFTTSDILPRPFLVTPSKSPWCRHLWYRVSPHINAHAAAKLADELRRLLTWCSAAKGLAGVGVEVKPDGFTSSSSLPPTPFGPWSGLCDHDGVAILEPDPVAALLLWHERASASAPRHRPWREHPSPPPLPAPGSNGAERLRDQACDVLTVQPHHASTPPPPPVAAPGDDSSTLDAVRDRPAVAPPEGRHPADDWASGPLDGHTNKQLPRVVRHIRCSLLASHDAAPPPEAVDLLLEWVRRGDGTLREHAEAVWAQRLAYYWTRVPLGGLDSAIVLRGDVRVAARLTRLLLPQARWRPRHPLFRCLVVVWAIARGSPREGDDAGTVGRTTEASLYSKHLQAVDDRYSVQLAALTRSGIIALQQAHRPPTTNLTVAGIIRRPGATAVYTVRMPRRVVGEEGYPTHDPKAVRDIALAMLDARDGILLVGSRKAWNSVANGRKVLEAGDRLAGR